MCFFSMGFTCIEFIQMLQNKDLYPGIMGLEETGHHEVGGFL